MKRKHIVAVIIAAIALAAVVLHTFTLSHKKTVLTFGMMAGSYWDVPNGNCYRIIDGTIKRFESEHPDVKVQYTSGILKRDYSEWLSEQLLKGRLPDVFMVQSDDFDTFSSIGALKPLNKFIDSDKDFNIGDYYKASFAAGTYHNCQYALPYESVPTLMFVNKTLLSKNNISVPLNNWTWDDFYSDCKKVTRDTNGDGVIDEFGFYGYTWKDAAYSNGASIFNSDGTQCSINDTRVEAAIKFIRDLKKLSGSVSPTSRDFDLGKVAFRPFLFSDYRTYNPYPWSIKKYSNFEWECIKMPAGPNGENTSMLNTLLMGINSNTKQGRLAWEFLKMLTDDPVTQQEIFKYSQGVSVLKSITKSKTTQDLLSADMPCGHELNIDAINDVMDSAVVEPHFKKYTSALQLADSRIDSLVSGGQNLGPQLTILKRDILDYIKQ